jgi:hypothetical protein
MDKLVFWLGLGAAQKSARSKEVKNCVGLEDANPHVRRRWAIVRAYIDESGEIQDQRGALRCWRRIVLNLWHAYIRAAQVGWDANVVVAMRLMRLAVGGALAQREAQRMVAEKVTASAEAHAAAITKMLMGGRMAAATKSASAVYQRKVRANRRRLTRR